MCVHACANCLVRPCRVLALQGVRRRFQVPLVAMRTTLRSSLLAHERPCMVSAPQQCSTLLCVGLFSSAACITFERLVCPRARPPGAHHVAAAASCRTAARARRVRVATARGRAALRGRLGARLAGGERRAQGAQPWQPARASCRCCISDLAGLILQCAHKSEIASLSDTARVASVHGTGRASDAASSSDVVALSRRPPAPPPRPNRAASSRSWVGRTPASASASSTCSPCSACSACSSAAAASRTALRAPNPQVSRAARLLCCHTRCCHCRRQVHSKRGGCRQKETGYASSVCCMGSTCGAHSSVATALHACGRAVNTALPSGMLQQRLPRSCFWLGVAVPVGVVQQPRRRLQQQVGALARAQQAGEAGGRGRRRAGCERRAHAPAAVRPRGRGARERLVRRGARQQRREHRRGAFADRGLGVAQALQLHAAWPAPSPWPLRNALGPSSELQV